MNSSLIIKLRIIRKTVIVGKKYGDNSINTLLSNPVDPDHSNNPDPSVFT